MAFGGRDCWKYPMNPPQMPTIVPSNQNSTASVGELAEDARFGMKEHLDISRCNGSPQGLILPNPIKQ